MVIFKELLLCVELLDFVYSLSDLPHPDFSADVIGIIIPADSKTFAVSTFITINDDNIDEDEQNFAIVAEILDVPEDISCFQTAPGTIPCFGTRGARITDNDCECIYLVHAFSWMVFCLSFASSWNFFFSAMVIGFTQRTGTVCECDALEGENLIPIDTEVATMRTAEREYPMVFRLQVSTSTAIVDSRCDITNPLLDACFSIKLHPDGRIQEEFDLEPLVATIPPLPAEIMDDLRLEEEECFTMRIFPVYVYGRRELFHCNEDEDGATSFFCETTICIEDNGCNECGCSECLYQSHLSSV